MSPQIWLSLLVDRSPKSDNWAAELVAKALSMRTVLDISAQPGLWGGNLRGTDAKLMASSDPHLERASSVSHAGMFIEAEVIQFLAAVGREHLDYYFVCPSEPINEFQIEGMNLAVSELSENGHIRNVGIDARRITTQEKLEWIQSGRFDFILENNTDQTTQFDRIQTVLHGELGRLPERMEPSNIYLVQVESAHGIQLLEPWFAEAAIG